MKVHGDDYELDYLTDVLSRRAAVFLDDAWGNGTSARGTRRGCNPASSVHRSDSRWSPRIPNMPHVELAAVLTIRAAAGDKLRASAMAADHSGPNR